MNDGRFSEILDVATPITGRRITEDGDFVNQSEMVLANSGYASRQEKVYRVFWYGTIPFGSTLYFDLMIPAGFNLWGFSRSSTAVNARVNSTFSVGGTPGSVIEEVSGNLFDERSGGGLSSCKLRRLDSYSGSSPRTPPMPITPVSSGPVKQSSTQTEVGFQPAFDENNLPVFIYENPSADTDADFYLELSFQEKYYN